MPAVSSLFLGQSFHLKREMDYELTSNEYLLLSTSCILLELLLCHSFLLRLENIKERKERGRIERKKEGEKLKIKRRRKVTVFLKGVIPFNKSSPVSFSLLPTVIKS